MNQSQLTSISDAFESDFNGADFDIVERDSVPSLDDLPRGKAARLTSVGYLFFDIRGFTAWAEGRHDKTVFKVLHPALAALARAARLHDGFIEKPTGDGLMILIGAKETDPERVAYSTLECAVDIAAVFTTVVVPFFKRKGYVTDDFGFGIGVEMGDALITKVGIRGHDFLSSIANAANRASKLENAASRGQILVGQTLCDTAPQSVRDGALALVGQVAGRNAYSLEYAIDKDGSPEPIAKFLSREQIGRFDAQRWLLGAVALGAIAGATVAKAHRFFGKG
ncbi:MAG TPA: adenylate/guanylate cyclase domain-containing protein [Deinococcales bacterium]|nr:adenylate/guanylate cyclase domain-containing protein [Deinococcales bacterium]